MGKKAILSLVLIVCLISGVTGVFAEGGGQAITEVPDVKIVMDGVITPYEYVPINVNSRTMLPLRELLINLGVPNDSEHIVWNGQEKSVTIYKDGTRIYLKVDSKTAYVNDRPVEMDVAPVLYLKNEKVYIPLRFVSDNLGKKVVFDGSFHAVLIRDLAEYNKTRDILDKSQAAMKDIKKYRMTIDVKAGFKSEFVSMGMGINTTGEYDMNAKKMHQVMGMDFLGMDIKTETYYADSASYTHNPFTSIWEKETLTPYEYDENFSNAREIAMPEFSEPFYAGLAAVPGINAHETLLKGDVYLKELFDKALEEGDNQATESMEEMDLEKYYMEIVIDNTTNLMKSLKMNMSGMQMEDGTATSVNIDIVIAMSDFDGTFEVTVPREVLDNAEETFDDESGEF